MGVLRRSVEHGSAAVCRVYGWADFRSHRSSTDRVERVDFECRSYKIEVKSSAYLQTWSQSGPSLIRFDIAKKILWMPQPTNSDTSHAFSGLLPLLCLPRSESRSV